MVRIEITAPSIIVTVKSQSQGCLNSRSRVRWKVPSPCPSQPTFHPYSPSNAFALQPVQIPTYLHSVILQTLSLLLEWPGTYDPTCLARSSNERHKFPILPKTFPAPPPQRRSKVGQVINRRNKWKKLYGTGTGESFLILICRPGRLR